MMIEWLQRDVFNEEGATKELSELRVGRWN